MLNHVVAILELRSSMQILEKEECLVRVEADAAHSYSRGSALEAWHGFI